MNELGVLFRKEGSGTAASPSVQTDMGIPELIGTDGSVDGSRYRHVAAHFEWLVRFGEALGVGFEEMGKRHHATPTTRFFCDELLRIYGSDDVSLSQGASYAVEHWAASGFWKELIWGLHAFRSRECPALPLGFFIWHDMVEEQHAAHTEDELRQAFDRPGFQDERFLTGAVEMLNGVQAFWDGLWADRQQQRAA